MQRNQDVILHADDASEDGELDDPVGQAMLQSLFDFMDRDDDSPCNQAVNKPAGKDNSVSRNGCFSFFQPNKPLDASRISTSRSDCYSWFQRHEKPVQSPTPTNNKSHRSVCYSFLKVPDALVPADHGKNMSRSPNKPK
jgi:hypothetical protein